jgi:hypothetical protein
VSRRTGPRLPSYRSGPLHLLGMVVTAAVAGYAGVRLLAANPVGIALWFAGAVVLHDLVLFPAYALADAALRRVARRRRPVPPAGARAVRSMPTRVPWLNHVRVPVLLSGLLLLVWFPLVLGLVDGRPALTGQPEVPYLRRWLLVTAALFAISALAYGLRMLSARRAGS